MSRRSTIVNTGIDADALVFLQAAAITDLTITNAINRLVLELKYYGLWTKMKAIYPFVGGTASTHKWNLKDPQDTNAAFRLVFNGGWTHSTNGALPNGTNAFADTFLVPSTELSANSGHLTYYSRTNSGVVSEIPCGVLNGNTGANGFNLVIRRDNNLNSFRATESTSANGLVDSSTTDARGFTIGSITSSTNRQLYLNSSLLNTNSNNFTWGRASSSVFIGAARNLFNNTAAFFTNKETAFNTIGDGINSTEASILYTIVQAFQTTLSRNV